MKNKFRKNRCVILLYIIVISSVWWCNGEEEEEGSSSGALMEKKEKEALYNAIQGFVGNDWNGSDLYPDPCGWTPIPGVSCDLVNEYWYVTDLNIGSLQDNSLTCTQNPEFRPQFFDLKHLKSLSFYNCFTSHNFMTLPTKNWEKLATTLESLEFWSNPSLIGPIPLNLGHLKLLKSLVLIQNGFSGTLPSNIGNLVLLKRLVISENNFSGRIPDTFGNLKDLLILDLSRNSLSGYIPFSIGYLNSLLKLDLSNNMLVGSIPISIGNLKNLTLLDLRGNKISGGLTKSIQEMKSLQELMLSGNPIGGDIINISWQKLQNLLILDLSNLSLSGQFPKSMINLKKLRYVGLSNNNLTGNLPSEIANMHDISAIYVNGNNLTGELKFSEVFYGRLKRRFGAWNNPNLCHTGGSDGPIGVKLCKSEDILVKTGMKIELRDGNVGMLQQNIAWTPTMRQSKRLNMDVISSFGVSSCRIDEVWWNFLKFSFIVVLLWNFYLL